MVQVRDVEGKEREEISGWVERTQRENKLDALMQPPRSRDWRLECVERELLFPPVMQCEGEPCTSSRNEVLNCFENGTEAIIRADLACGNAHAPVCASTHGGHAAVGVARVVVQIFCLNVHDRGPRDRFLHRIKSKLVCPLIVGRIRSVCSCRPCNTTKGAPTIRNQIPGLWCSKHPGSNAMTSPNSTGHTAAHSSTHSHTQTCQQKRSSRAVSRFEHVHRNGTESMKCKYLLPLPVGEFLPRNSEKRTARGRIVPLPVNAKLACGWLRLVEGKKILAVFPVPWTNKAASQEAHAQARPRE